MIWRMLFISLFIVLGACNSGEPVELPTRIVLDVPLATATAASFDTAEFVNILNFWEAAEGVLEGGRADAWRFFGYANDAIVVRLVGADVILTLATEAGEVLQRGDTIQYLLPTEGIYTIIVQALASDENEIYEIGLSYSDRPNPAAVVPSPLPQVVGVPTPAPSFSELGTYISRLISGDAVGGLMNINDPDHIYTFDGIMGEFVELEASYVSGEIDPTITLYDPSGLPIAMDSDSGGNQNAWLRNIRLPEDGVYTVQINGGGLPGGYALSFQRSGVFIPPTITPIPLVVATPTVAYELRTPELVVERGNRLEAATPVLGFLDAAHVSAVHPIYVAEGEIITIGVQVEGNADLKVRLELRHPSGEAVAHAETDENGDAVIAGFQAAIEGAFQVVVTAISEDAGQYIIAYRRGGVWAETLLGPVARDEIHQGEITRNGVADIWTVELKAGDIITAAVNPVLSLIFDPVIEIVPVHDPHSIIAMDDNGGGGFSAYIPRAVIPDTGLYLVRVYAAHGETTGAYTLIWRYITVAPTVTPALQLSPVLTLTDVVPDQTYNFYPFQGKSGGTVRIRVVATGEGFDPVVALVDPEGNVLVEVDDTDGDLNPVVVFTLPADGTYNVRVNGYLQGGAFQLLVEDVLN